MINFIQISNNTAISIALFYEDSRRLSKRSLNIHMYRVNFDKQYLVVNIYIFKASLYNEPLEK